MFLKQRPLCAGGQVVKMLVARVGVREVIGVCPKFLFDPVKGLVRKSDKGVIRAEVEILLP